MPDCYDVEGRKVFRPDSHRRGAFHPTFPPGRYLSQPLEHWCSDFEEMRTFLRGCKYVSDKEQFQKDDYWFPPDEFEKTKKGDCEDFALWAWRQLIHMNYPARFVTGRAGRYGEGHAWVAFRKDQKWYLLEPLASIAGTNRPRLSVVTYKPNFSMAWDGKNISYYAHEDRNFKVPPERIPGLVFEWVIYWTLFWLRFTPKIILGLFKRLKASSRLRSREGWRRRR